MSTRRSNGRPAGRPIFIAKNSKTCASCGKWKIGDSFNLPSSNLVCNKCEHKAWHRQKCDEYGSSGARNVRLISRLHVLCTACAAVRYRLEVKSVREIQISREGNASHKRRVRRGLNHEHPVSGHRPNSVDEAFFMATLDTKEQLPMLCTVSGSIQELGRPKQKSRHHK